MQDEERMNLAAGERVASLVGGGTLMAYALKRRSPVSIVPALIAAELLYRGVTGHCPVYGALGVNSADGNDRGLVVQKAVTVNRSAEDLYETWRDVENLPRFMHHLRSVTAQDDRLSHWVADVPTGLPIEWDAQIVEDHPNELIRWEVVPGAVVHHHGSVQFRPAPDDRGTEVVVTIAYEPPGGGPGEALARLLEVATAQQIKEDIRRFKQIMETGETATVEGQPAGKRLRRDRILTGLTRKG